MCNFPIFVMISHSWHGLSFSPRIQSSPEPGFPSVFHCHNAAIIPESVWSLFRLLTNPPSEMCDVSNSYIFPGFYRKINLATLGFFPLATIDPKSSQLTFNLKKIFYLFIFRERGREGETEGEKHECFVASHVPPTGDLVHKPGMWPDRELNQWPFGSQAGTQSTKPYQPGQLFVIPLHHVVLQGPKVFHLPPLPPLPSLHAPQIIPHQPSLQIYHIWSHFTIFTFPPHIHFWAWSV